jgi:propionyl-CoA synthetase
MGRYAEAFRFSDGVLNTCFNALDRHVRDGRGD